MAASDAMPIPKRAVAYRCYFTILDADGDPMVGVTFTSIGGTTAKASISLDGAAAADSTNPITEVSNARLYFLDLTVGEMTADFVYLLANPAAAVTGAKATPIFLYPEEAGDIRVDVRRWLGTAVLASVGGVPEVDLTHWFHSAVAVNIAGTPKVDATHWRGQALAPETTPGVPEVDVTYVQGVAAPALVGGRVDASVGAMAANTLTAAAVAADVAAELQAGLATAAALATVQADTDDIQSRLTTVQADTDDIQSRLTTVQADTDDIQARLPAALVLGRIDASVGAMAANVITAASTAADYVTEIQSGLSLGSALATAQADLDDIQTRLPAALSGGKMDSIVSGTVPANVVSIAADVITAASIAADALTATKFAADVATELANGLLDLANAVETGVSLRGAIRLILSAAAAKCSGLGTTTAVFRNAVADSKDRITAVVDTVGNRSSVVTDTT